MTGMNRRDAIRLIGTAALACAAPPSPAAPRSMDKIPPIGLGTWQGVYLWEHRSAPHARRVVVTVMGE